MYRIVTHNEVAAQTEALPENLLLAYLGALDLLELAPWSGAPYNEAKPDAAMRSVRFGPDGRGEIIYLILENDRTVELLRLYWL